MQETNGKRLRAVILDVDGTLIDSNDAHAEAWKQVGIEFGKRIPFHAARALVGMGGDKVLPRLTGLEKESSTGKQITSRRDEIFLQRYLPNLKPLPGARDLLQRCKDAGLALVVATSAGKNELEAILKQAGVEDLIEDALSSSDVDESKPAPDIVVAALERAGCNADEAIMIGDTPYDVEAALNAGVPVIAFRSGGWGDRDLEGASQIFDGPADLLAHFDQSALSGAARAARKSVENQRYGRRRGDLI